MNKTKNIIGIVAVVVFVAGGIYFATKSPDYSDSTPLGSSSVGSETTNPNQGTTGSTTETTGATTPTSYSLADVAKHNSAASCWTAINGNVYDVTSWIGQHPGGEQAILSLCGIDGSAAFNDQHGGQRRPEQELASFKIGALK